MKGKRILSAVLSAALLLQLSPLAVFAEDTSLLPAAAQTVQTEPAPEEPTASLCRKRQGQNPPPRQNRSRRQSPPPRRSRPPGQHRPRSPRQSLPPHRRQRKRLRRTLRKRLPLCRLRNPRQPPTPRQRCRR